MTTPAQPPFDTGNALFGETPAQMTTALIDTPAGQRLALTLRTASTTMTVLLQRDDARNWAQLIKQVSDQMSGLIVAGAGAMPSGVLGKAAGQ